MASNAVYNTWETKKLPLNIWKSNNFLQIEKALL